MNHSTAYYLSPIGALRIESRGEGIAAVLFVNSRKRPVIDEKTLDFSPSSVPVILQCIRELGEYFEGKRSVFGFPLAQSGTPFQETVWQALLSIPAGRTISYMTLSKKINNVKAIRAVGTANGSNNICIIVPCHRVIGSNGSLVGYGGDLWRKSWLLEHEAKMVNAVQTLF